MKFFTVVVLCSLSLIGFQARCATAAANKNNSKPTFEEELCKTRWQCPAVIGCDVYDVKQYCQCPLCPMKEGEECGATKPCRSGLVCMKEMGKLGQCQKQSDLQIGSSSCDYNLIGHTIEGNGTQFSLNFNYNQCTLEIRLSAEQNVIRFQHGRDSAKPMYMFANGRAVKNGDSVTVPEPHNVVFLKVLGVIEDMEIKLLLPIKQGPACIGVKRIADLSLMDSSDPKTTAFVVVKAKCGHTKNLMIRYGPDEAKRPLMCAATLIVDPGFEITYARGVALTATPVTVRETCPYVASFGSCLAVYTSTGKPCQMHDLHSSLNYVRYVNFGEEAKEYQEDGLDVSTLQDSVSNKLCTAKKGAAIVQYGVYKEGKRTHTMYKTDCLEESHNMKRYRRTKLEATYLFTHHKVNFCDRIGGPSKGRIIVE